MHLFARRLVAAGHAASVCSFVYSEKAEAATANTIRGEFGLQLSQDIAPLEEELQRVQQTIRTTHEVELHSAVIASTSIDEIDAKISALTATVDLLHGTAVNGIDLPLENILRYEAEYRKTVDNLNTLLGVRDFYIVDPPLTPDKDLETLLRTGSSLRSSIEEAGYYGDTDSMDYYPIEGQTYKVNSSFGFRYDSVDMRGYNLRYGMSLKTPQDTPIGTWFSGTVESTDTSYDSENCTWIDYGYDVCSYYCHLSRIDVKKGQNVSQGTRIALSGSTGYYPTGPHFHPGLYIDGMAVDLRVALE